MTCVRRAQPRRQVPGRWVSSQTPALHSLSARQWDQRPGLVKLSLPGPFGAERCEVPPLWAIPFLLLGEKLVKPTAGNTGVTAAFPA